MVPSLDIKGHVASLTLRRSTEANKLTPEDLVQIKNHVQTVNSDLNVLVLVLRSEGKYFCSGFDISAIASASQVEGSSFGEMVDAVEACRAVTIASVQGGVYGGATDLVLACDFRLGCEATEMFMPAVRLGLHYYQSGMERYVSRLGLDTAKRLFLTAEKLDAQSMRACGFLTQLGEKTTLDRDVQQLAATLGAMAPIPLLGMKKHLNQIGRGKADAAAIQADVRRSIESDDLSEGGRAWKEKRQAIFKGC